MLAAVTLLLLWCQAIICPIILLLQIAWPNVVIGVPLYATVIATLSAPLLIVLMRHCRKRAVENLYAQAAIVLVGGIYLGNLVFHGLWQ